MSSRNPERRTERATAEDVAEIERQLWEFLKRIDPPSVPEAKLRPGAFLWRVHRTWHDLGRGTGGLASRSFRALRDELLKRDPPVRNLQPKLYGNAPLAQAEAEQLIDVMLESWHLERKSTGKWQASPIYHSEGARPAYSQEMETIRGNLLHTLFRGDEQILLEEPLGIPPEFFFEKCGREALGLVIATSPETIVNLSPSNAQAGFSQLVGRFFEAAEDRKAKPLLIWIYRLPAIRDNPEFHQAYQALAVHSAAITNWYLRLSRFRDEKRNEAGRLWQSVFQHCAFAIHGLSNPTHRSPKDEGGDDQPPLDEDLLEIGPDFFLPQNLPVKLASHPHVRRNPEYSYGMMMEITDQPGDEVRYWLFPERPKRDLDDTAETTGLPAFATDISPGADYDRAYSAIFQATRSKSGVTSDKIALSKLETLNSLGWRIFSIAELQNALQIDKPLRKSID